MIPIMSVDYNSVFKRELENCLQQNNQIEFKSMQRAIATISILI